MQTIIAVAGDAAALFGCLLAVDFLTGVVHWAEDTYTEPGRSALLDRLIVLDNIEHHRRPGAIRDGSYWSTNAVCIGGSAIAAALLALFHVHAWQPYLVAALASQANHVHLWAHSSARPRPVRWLQAAGVLQSRAHHGGHHTRPFASRFCAYTNFLNPMLDAVRFRRGLEWTLARCGVATTRGNLARAGY